MIIIKLRVDKRVRDTVWFTVFAGKRDPLSGNDTNLQSAGKLVLREQEWCAFAHSLLCGADLSGRQFKCVVDNLDSWNTERPELPPNGSAHIMPNEVYPHDSTDQLNQDAALVDAEREIGNGK